MVWCKVHYRYFNGRKAKINHAYDKEHPCSWMQKYLRKR
jgi:hypothetical protein